MSSPSNKTLSSSPSGGYKGVNTLLKHWGNTELAVVSDKQKKICEDSGLDSLLHLFRMPHVKVQGLALAVINTLVEGENGDIHIESEEGFKPLVELTKFPEDEVQREAVWALAILASNNSCQARIEQEVGWHNFRKYAASAIPEIQAERNQENLMLKGVPLLLNMLTETKDAKVRRAVVTALSNVSIIEGFGAKDVWIEKGIELMMPYIEQGTDLQLQIGALNTIANVCNHDKATELKRKVAELGGIGRLVQLLDSQDEMVVKLVAMTIANMGSDDNHRNIMHRLHTEEPLIRLLDSRDEEVQLGVTMAINALAEHELACEEFKLLHASEPLKELIHITKDRDISKEAKEALCKISPEDYESLHLKDMSIYTGSSYSSSAHNEDSYSSSYISDDQHDSVDRSESQSDSDSDIVHHKEEAKRLDEQQKPKEEIEQKKQEQQMGLGDRRLNKLEREETVRLPDDLDEMPNNIGQLDTHETYPEQEVRAKRSESGRRRRLSTSYSDTDPISQRDPKGRGISQNLIESREISRDLGENSKTSDRRKREEEQRENLQSKEEPRNPDVKKEGINREDINNIIESGNIDDERIRSGSNNEPDIRLEDVHRPIDLHQPFQNHSLDRVRGRGDDTPRTASLDSVVIPKNPAKNLVLLLREANYKKGLSREGLHELERFAAKREKDQLPVRNRSERKFFVSSQHGFYHLTLSGVVGAPFVIYHASINELHVGEDIIHSLVYIITYYPENEFPDILSLCLYLMGILCRYHVKNQIAIRRHRGGDHILRLLRSPIEPVRRNAALALGAYTLNNKSVQAEVTRAIPLLVQLLQEKQLSAPTLRTVAACLAVIADSNPSNQDQVIKAGGLWAAADLMPVDKHFIRSSLNLISAIVSHNTDAQNSVLKVHPDFLSKLVAMLASPQEFQYRDAITNTLVELAKKNRSVKKAIFRVGGVSKLASLLNSYQSDNNPTETSVMINAAYLLYSMIRVPKLTAKVRRQILRSGVTDKLKSLCSSRSAHLADVARNLTNMLDQRPQRSPKLH